MNRGVLLPVHAYPLFENALRAANGWSLDEHAARIGALWSRFSEVAAGNPNAWIRAARTAHEIVTPSPRNRMISFPYTKLCTANMQVDQGAGYIVCSVEAARAAGVPEDRWVFPLSGADGNDHWYISNRAELHRSPAIRLAGQAALERAGLGVDDVALVDLYSCFPAVVQMAARELGLPLDDPDRPLTLTGGLTFGGGPGNNYTSHGIAQAVRGLRAAPGSTALVTGLGWYATKHSVGVYASRPPGTRGCRAFRLARRPARGGRTPRSARGSRSHRSGAGGDLYRDVRPRGHSRAGHRRLPTPRHAGPGVDLRHRHAGALCAEDRSAARDTAGGRGPRRSPGPRVTFGQSSRWRTVAMGRRVSIVRPTLRGPVGSEDRAWRHVQAWHTIW